MSISTYLAFNGNCREAITFLLGGKLSLQTVGESPIAEQLPAPMKNCILHATLAKGELTLMGSDLVGKQGLQKGNGVAMMLHCSSEDDIKSFYEKLYEGGKQTHPLEHTH